MSKEAVWCSNTESFFLLKKLKMLLTSDCFLPSLESEEGRPVGRTESLTERDINRRKGTSQTHGTKKPMIFMRL